MEGLLETLRETSPSEKGTSADVDGVIAAIGAPSRPFDASKLRAETSGNADVLARAAPDLPNAFGLPTAGEASHEKLRQDGPPHRHGTHVSDLFAHSWRPIPSEVWRWIPKRACLGKLGFVARASEVRRLGSRAQIVRRVRNPPPLQRSFVEAVKEGVMDRERGRYPRRFGGGVVLDIGWGVREAPPMSGWKKMI